MTVHRVCIVNVRYTAKAMPWDVDRNYANGWPCPYCWVIMDRAVHARAATWDHVIPRAQGGGDERANLLPVCRSCNTAKDRYSLPEWHGILLAQNDARAPKTLKLIEWICGDDGDLTAFMAGEAGKAYAGELARLRRLSAPAPANLEPIDFAAEQRKRQDFERMVWDALSSVGIPRTHWALKPPRHVSVLLGSLPEMIEVKTVEDLVAHIKAHPRYAATTRKATA